MTRYRLWTLMSLSALALFAGDAYAAPRVWELSTKGPSTSLTLGAPDSPEDIDLVFSCEKRSGKIRLFVAETDERFKPKQRAKAALSVGTIETTVAGAFTPNEDAGVASFEAELSQDDPIFHALRGSKRLGIRIGAWTRSFQPLGESGDAEKFAATCRR